MRDFPEERYNEENAARAFAEIAAHRDFDIIRWALLCRYAEIKKIFSFTDPTVINRAAGKMEELEWVLDKFGEQVYGGLPNVDGTSSILESQDLNNPEIGGGYPRGTGS